MNDGALQATYMRGSCGIDTGWSELGAVWRDGAKC